ncbi:DUF6551 family protein [Oscillibacter sp.]|uniref:DUF6551 family protein n=1 Tax=Oscillibacter sp. TaxID=1945593 RepID=UPI002898E3C2|nr:DUF6551 family protein [Oscillibacter sp.]
MKYIADYKYSQVNTKNILVDPLGQRNVESRQAQFRKILKSFNPYLVNPVKVGVVNGKYYCFDGQMTMKVLKARNGGRDLLVECKIYYGLTLSEIADLFLLQNGTQSAIETQDKLRVMYNYGDPEVTEFVHSTEGNQIRIDWTKGNAKNKVVAVTSMFDAWRKIGDPLQYSEYCKVLREAWGGEPDSFRREIINGLCLFMVAYRGKYRINTLVRKLGDVSPQKIIRDGLVSTSSGYRKYAVQILNAYNRKNSTNRLPELL